MTKSNSTIQKGISGSTLKIIAVAAMLLDHIGATLTPPYLADGTPSVLYAALRIIGRTAFPVFCFLLVEGFFHTKNLKKYCLRLALFALISEVPFNLAFSQTLYDPYNQNVFFTLLIGLLVISGMQQLKIKASGKPLLTAIGHGILLAAGMYAAWFLDTDYSSIGVLVIVLFYDLHFHRTLAFSAACILLIFSAPIELGAFLALPLIVSYNGTKGLSMKYVFYLFYPAHLLLLGILKLILFP